MSLFGRLFDGLLAERPGRETETSRAAPPGGRAGPALQEALDTMEHLLRKESGTGAAGEAAARADREALLEAEREANRNALCQDILEFHGRLRTGLDGPALDRLRRALVAHAAPAGASVGASVVERIDRQVLRHLYARAGERAWERLQQLMGRAETAWPAPPELALGRTPEEHRSVVEQSLTDARLAFLLSPAEATADLMSGWVAVWSHYYPPRGSPLWCDTALAGVGGALRAVHFLAVVEAWLWRSPRLEERVRGLLEDPLEAIRTLVAHPDPSVAEGARVAESVNRLLAEEIPRAVWDEVAGNLEWDDGVPGGLAVSTLSGHPGVTDPVCGMTLQAEQVADRSEWRGRVRYFCSASCRAAFLAEPERFAAEAR